MKLIRLFSCGIIALAAMMPPLSFAAFSRNGLDEEVIKAAQASRFSPATKDGQAVPYWIKLDVEFQRTVEIRRF